MNLVTVEMGRCTFVAPRDPHERPAREAVRVPLEVDGETLPSPPSRWAIRTA